MAPQNLDVSLLMKIMIGLGEFRGKRSPQNPPTTGELMKLVSDVTAAENGQVALNYLNRHVDFLVELKYLRIKHPGIIHRGLELTAKGQMFLQPELAEFGQQPMLPQVVRSLESEIQVLTYPQEQKDGMLYRLREAVAKQAPDVIAKVIVEVGAKIVGGGGN